MPLFSIVTVCLNDYQNLKRTIESVICQDFQNYEYLIIDGGSTDGSIDYIRSIKDIKYISEVDNGIFDAMNKALNMVIGEFVCFLNAGDTFPHNNILGKVANEIEYDSEISFFYGDVYYPNSIRPCSIQPKRLTPFVLFRGTVCHQAWFVRREIYNQLKGFDINLKYKGDYDVLLRAIYLLNVCYKHLPFCVVKYHGGGFSENSHYLSRSEFEDVRRRYISSQRAIWYSFILHLVNFIRKNKIYQRFMANLTAAQARRLWGNTLSK